MAKYIIMAMALALLVACSSSDKNEAFNITEEFAKANEDFEDKRHEDARMKFENIIRMDTEYIFAPLAQLRVADSYVADDNPELAIEEFRRFLDTYPRHKYAAYAQYNIGLVYFKLIKGPERGYGAALNALDAFRELNGRYPRNPYRQDAELKIEHSEDIIAEHELMVASFYFKRTAYHGAIERFDGLVEAFPKYGDNPEVLWRLAVSHKGLGDNARSDEYLQRLISLFPDSKYVKKARKHISKLQDE